MFLSDIARYISSKYSVRTTLKGNCLIIEAGPTMHAIKKEHCVRSHLTNEKHNALFVAKTARDLV